MEVLSLRQPSMVPKTQQHKPQSWMGGQNLQCPRAASWDSKPSEAFRGPADGDCSHEIKRHLLLGKVMTNLDSIFQSRDITLPTKVHLVKGMVFPVVMYECESWTIKKAERQRTDAFELWCCRRLLRVPWTARRSNQSILRRSVLNINWKDWCWSWSSNTLATWWKELTQWKRPWCWEGLKVGGEGDDRGSDGWMTSLTQWTWVWVNSGS